MCLVEGLADFQDFVDVRFRAHILEEMAHHALLVDHEGRAQQARLRMPVHDLVLPAPPPPPHTLTPPPPRSPAPPQLAPPHLPPTTPAGPHATQHRDKTINSTH